MNKSLLYQFWYTLCVCLLSIASVSCVMYVEAKYPHDPQVLLVYLAADNRLTPDATQTIVNGVLSGRPEESNQLVLVYHTKADGTNVLSEVTCHNSKVLLKPIDDHMLSENIPPDEMLARVVEKMQALYPDQTYNLLLRTSANGWLPDPVRTNPFKKATDEDMQQTLQYLCAKIPDDVLHTLAFETGFSSNIEALYPLRRKAKYLLVTGTERIEPGYTPVYPSHLLDLSLGNLKRFGEALSIYYYGREHELERAATYSIIDTDYLEDLADYVAMHCRPVPLYEPQVDAYQHYDRTDYHLGYDFGEYYSSLLATDAEREHFKKLLDRCVVWKQTLGHFQLLDEGYSIMKHSGLTTYILQRNLPTLNATYQASTWWKRISHNP